MDALILSAGQGRRLLPHTAELPKCLLDIAGRTVLERQLVALASAGVQRVAVVVGFAAAAVEAEIERCRVPGLQVRAIHNSLYDRTDNLVSCLMARDAMTSDFLLVNGDTLFQPEILTRLLTSRPAPVSMAVACKSAYDSDDMKVQMADGRVSRVGKDLAEPHTDGEAIGICLLRQDGPRLFLESLEAIAEQPDGHARYYLSAINVMAGRGLVDGVPIGDLRSIEIDFPQDLERARVFVPTWPGADASSAQIRSDKRLAI